jgi:hypothetical protein
MKLAEKNGGGKLAEETLHLKLVIPKWERRSLHLTIEGVTPLLTDHIPEFVLDNIIRKQAGQPLLPVPKRDERQIFEDSLYVIDAEAGRYGFPYHGIRKSICRAAQRHHEDKGLTLVRMYGLISVPDGIDGYAEIIAPPPVPSKMAARNKSRQIVPAIRAKFMPWSIDLEVFYNYPGITEDEVLSLVNLAGSAVGIGAARVECGMTYGQFQISEVRSAIG